MEMYQQVVQGVRKPDTFIFVQVLNACAGLKSLEVGKSIHTQIIENDCETDVYVGSALMDMYAKCGSIVDALTVFKKMPVRNVVSWNIMIQAYVKSGQGQKALDLGERMRHSGVAPDCVTFAGLLCASGSLVDLVAGRRLHKEIIASGLESNVFVGSCLIDMYAKCGAIDDARDTFNKMPTCNVVTWSSMILGLVKCGQGQDALNLFDRMQRAGVDPNPITFVGVLNACASVRSLDRGRKIHAQITRSGFGSNRFVGSGLIDMYSKCGSIWDAWSVFSQMRSRDVPIYSAMILGLAKCGEAQKALDVYAQMQREGMEPDTTTFVGILNACASVVALNEGRLIHEKIILKGCESEVFVGNSLIDMYAKCGSVEEAERVFKKMPTRNVVSWTSMLGGYAMHGYAKEALAHFEQMSQSGVGLNEITFVCLLSACSHGGLVDEGLHYFKSMTTIHKVPPTVNHYACVVDLFGRAGRLTEAEDLINNMPIKPSTSVWMALLGACRVYGNVEIGERAAKKVLELDPQKAGCYVLLSNIYAAAGQWDSGREVQRLRLARGVKKEPGLTWIEVNNKVHSFIVDDQQHPQIVEIHAELKSLSEKMKQAGYVPHMKAALQDEEEGDKLESLSYHSEMLAIAYGIINTVPGTPVRIFKNLRVCGDCHMATKLISKVADRTIIVRDANRFHHFKDGLCSCKDYW